jgi:hypothetical protein
MVLFIHFSYCFYCYTYFTVDLSLLYPSSSVLTPTMSIPIITSVLQGAVTSAQLVAAVNHFDGLIENSTGSVNVTVTRNGLSDSVVTLKEASEQFGAPSFSDSALYTLPWSVVGRGLVFIHHPDNRMGHYNGLFEATDRGRYHVNLLRIGGTACGALLSQLHPVPLSQRFFVLKGELQLAGFVGNSDIPTSIRSHDAVNGGAPYTAAEWAEVLEFCEANGGFARVLKAGKCVFR